ncbi:hypothetical protein [Flavobacterium dankookense]|uniref:LTXXQ motif family protein n=1 Tax=Flavobacterium dankookense TaxID=706186 RepID=A0A4R6QAS8_9FLAO|nr:hypothetical protein [Flavobacterium dankookense]TDP58369.1 hypothetical protein BC748_2412 [Flavobacterium dankookense]
MKKIIAVLTLCLAFTLGANAQDKKGLSKEEIAKTEKLRKELPPEVAGKNDAIELIKYLGLDEKNLETFARLFTKKYKVLTTEGLTAERKSELAGSIEAKLRAGLTAEQMKKLDQNPELLNRLIKQ